MTVMIDSDCDKTSDTVIELAQLRSEARRLRWRLSNHALNSLIGQSAVMDRQFDEIQRASESDACVLIYGEPGTGLELIARAIHGGSRGNIATFVRIDCRGEQDRELLSRKLGTGADPYDADPDSQNSAGVGETILLDNVDCLPLTHQAMVVRALERAESESNNGEKRIRLIAATHVDLAPLVRDGQFRDDLWHRLKVITIFSPTLRERREDILLLADHFLNQFAVVDGVSQKVLSRDAVELLTRHDWPGNVSELRNVLHSASMLTDKTVITAEMLKPWLSDEKDGDVSCVILSLREMEQKLIETTFTRCGGNRERTAQSLKIGLRTLSGKLRQYGYPPRGGPGSNQKKAA